MVTARESRKWAFYWAARDAESETWGANLLAHLQHFGGGTRTTSVACWAGPRSRALGAFLLMRSLVLRVRRIDVELNLRWHG